MFSRVGAYGAIHALLAVALGAFGAHGLEGKISNDMLDVFETGVRYHMYHGLGLLLLALIADRIGTSKRMLWAGRLMHIGIFLFSGSLYALSLTDLSVFGPITPFGGVAFIAAWALTAMSLWRSSSR
ncbi:DUF423 domain-containing protein [Paenibacillus mendelii]|uniref:DUF423 domain-containing protein n=1 Tax=Paenibacillus mendelii TaxID=206163 RepID=A0ABV6JBH3_9BACL|nr:DUF423 domain-containing protein [Paenibacillus mendelii]MCQ6558602.1 DUF423 domain-containing protein [Paenibacillus mendelii]